MMGQSLLSASLPMTQAWLLGQRGMLLSSTSLTGWRNELTETLGSSAKRSVKPCTWWGTITNTSTCWGTLRWIAAWGALMTWANDAHLWQRRLPISWFSRSKVLPAGWGRCSFSSALLLPPLKYCVSSGLLNTRQRYSEAIWQWSWVASCRWPC